MSVLVPVDFNSLFEFFESRIDSLSGNTRAGYRAALGLFKAFMGGRPMDSVGRDVIDDWFVGMCLQGLSAKTAIHYVENVGALFGAAAREGLVTGSDVIRDVARRLREASAASLGSDVTDTALSRLLEVARMAGRQKGEIAVYTDMLLYSLAGGAMPLGEVAMTAKAGAVSASGRLADIARRHAEPSRRYLFPLDQSRRTPRRLRSHVEEKMRALLRYRGISTSVAPVDDVIRSLWAFAALKCGASATDVAGVLGGAPAGMRLLSVCEVRPVDAGLRESLGEAVARMLLDDPEQWFAMRFRPGVRFEQIERRFDMCAGEITRPEIFYPCEAIARRIGRRLVYRDKPLISDVAFFRTRVTDIYPMFRHLADLAWCYRDNGSEGTRYAVIPPVAMRRFQEAIGKFTPGYEIAPAGALPLRKGDRIVIIGGTFEGMEGLIAATPHEPAAAGDGGIIYRILFPDANGIEWRVDIDSRLVRKSPA